MTLRAGDVIDQTTTVRCRSCKTEFEIEGRHAAPACPSCGHEEFEEAARS